MRVQLVLDQRNLLGLPVGISQLLHQARVVFCRAPPRALDDAEARQRLEGCQQAARALALYW